MRTLVRAIQDLSRVRTVDDIAAVVRSAARELAGADGATFVLRDGEQCWYLDEDAISPLWKGLRFPAESCVSGWAMQHREVVVISDIYVDPRIPVDAYRPTFVHSLAMVPVRSTDPIAAIGVYWAANHAASAEEVEMLQLLADSTATAMENAWLHANMRRQVEERTRDLQLAREQAEQANQLKSRFLAAASHNLRQPLQALSTAAAIMKRAPAEAPAHLASVEETVRNMQSMLDTLLDLHRLEAGAIEPRLRDASLEGMFARLRSEFAYAASAKSLALTMPSSAPSVHSDPELLQEIVRNFLSNAVKYTARGEVRLDCRERDGTWRIEVSDTGGGIPAEHRARIFDAFYRTPDAADSSTHGLGLGLSIVQQLARILGCEVGVDSTPGQGSRFWIDVPRARAAAVAAQPQPAPAAKPQASTARSGRILYVEDHPGVREATSSLLRIEGYDVRACADGPAATHAVVDEKFSPDLVISDYYLPGGDTGDDVVKRVRGALDVETPALLLTGRTRDGVGAASATAHRVLHKPVDANQLLEAIAAAMAR